MSLAAHEIEKLANGLIRAEHDRRPIQPLTDAHPDLTADDAYRIQRAIVESRLLDGDAIAGWKVGLTSRAMQEMLGVDQPDYGPILSSAMVLDGGSIDSTRLISPKAEAEIGFVLNRALVGPDVTARDVEEATAGVVAALEVIDSRIQGWRIRLADTIADLASTARVVASDRLVPIRDVDLRTIEVVMSKNGTPTESGNGAAVLGNPSEAVAWAANTLALFGVKLEAGQIVMPGALHRAVDVAAGDVVEAHFDRLGSVSVRFHDAN